MQSKGRDSERGLRAGTGSERRGRVQRGGDLGVSKSERGLYSWEWVERSLNLMSRNSLCLDSPTTTLVDIINNFSLGPDFDICKTG